MASTDVITVSVHTENPSSNTDADVFQRYHVGMNVWVQCEVDGWRQGSIMEIDGDLFKVKVVSGQLIDCVAPLHIVGNPQNVNDLQEIRPLHDASVLENIKVRFQDDQFYTYTGKSLIAINPMKPVAELYDRSHILTYHSIDELSELHCLPPHIYAVGETAFRQMMQTHLPQSVIVSGESGAGKTVTSRYLLQYFTIVAALKKEVEEEPELTKTLRHHISTHSFQERGGMESKIIVSNTILEAFGNATTLRNENSSRFGKYLRLQFGERGGVCGASIQTYLLERSRVVHHSPGERAFHIFYQLCYGATDEEKVKWRLTRPCNTFQYTAVMSSNESGDDPFDSPTTSGDGSSGSTNNVSGGMGGLSNGITRQSSSPAALPGAPKKAHYVRQNSPSEDAKEMLATRKAFKDLGVNDKTQSDVFQILAAILHLGQVDIATLVYRGLDENDGNSSLAVAADLLGVKSSEITHMLKHRRITAKGEVFYKPTTTEEAAALRDTLAKAIYLALFLWVVDQINVCTSADAHENYIGILDIYGFECFAYNDLEQLCINYANEKLQQQSIAHIFREEQSLYEREGIQWSFVEFADNSPCLDLLEGTASVISLLNEQCSLKRAADPQAYTERVYQEHTKHPCFNGLKAGSVTCKFTVKHYAMDVTYSTQSFIMKNLDDISPEFVELIHSSTIGFVRNLFQQNELKQRLNIGTSAPLHGRKAGPSTVMSRFKASLNGLMDMLNNTTPHYIRCIKPNYEQSGYLSSAATTLSIQPTTQADRSTQLLNTHDTRNNTRTRTPTPPPTNTKAELWSDMPSTSTSTRLHTPVKGVVSSSARRGKRSQPSVGGIGMNGGDANGSSSSTHSQITMGKRSTTRKRQSQTQSLIVFDGKHVLEQLHGAGIIDIVRISQAGYPYRFDYDEFIDMYWPTVGDSVLDPAIDSTDACGTICACLKSTQTPNESNVQYGETMLFMRSNEMYALDHMLHVATTNACVKIQSWARGEMVRKMIREWKEAVVVMQKYTRMIVARKRFLRAKSAAGVLQTRWRGYAARSRYIFIRSCVIAIQAQVKRFITRRQFMHTRNAAIKIQTRVRGYQARQVYADLTQKRLVSAIFLQRNIRVWLEEVRERHAVEEQIAQLQLTIALLQGSSTSARKRSIKGEGSGTSTTPNTTVSPFSSASGPKLPNKQRIASGPKPRLASVGEDSNIEYPVVTTDNSSGMGVCTPRSRVVGVCDKAKSEISMRGLTQQSLDTLTGDQSSIQSIAKSTYVNVMASDVTDVYINVPAMSDLLLQGIKVHLSNTSLDMFRVSINIMGASPSSTAQHSLQERELEVKERIYVQRRLAMSWGETARNITYSKGLLGALDSTTIAERASQHACDEV
eukprot:CFRG6244T1